MTVDPRSKLVLSDEEWQQRLSPQQYQVLRRHGTEPAFCGGYAEARKHGDGTYFCAGCGLELFESKARFESGTGWPSFFRPIEGNIEESIDSSYNMTRTEVHCAKCGGHMGHVFSDGPRPTGLRYCINAISLKFRPS